MAELVLRESIFERTERTFGSVQDPILTLEMTTRMAMAIPIRGNPSILKAPRSTSTTRSEFLTLFFSSICTSLCQESSVYEFDVELYLLICSEISVAFMPIRFVTVYACLSFQFEVLEIVGARNSYRGRMGHLYRGSS